MGDGHLSRRYLGLMTSYISDSLYPDLRRQPQPQSPYYHHYHDDDECDQQAYQRRLVSHPQRRGHTQDHGDPAIILSFPSIVLLSGPRTAVLPLFKPVYLRCDGHKSNGSWDEGRRSQSGYTIERSVNPDFEEEFEFWMHR
ncbi:uncharacterized protein PADG_11070 [Paracoccidioides brasiliensis Pb18]|uniref:Uncharacterized protein n=1 Tax=Paracoccidioides brasiliensis (strain Pb18) TaxID=502780 RepID=A0A0A0HZ36_PARBD|nr:uncharacterized protein PADG_11070 [Paracoccidioides brasiliensis Pb18]KGM92620.1 hypothetical protein PADG_11070 [Paracoccidioides brasiliensis Pb18]